MANNKAKILTLEDFRKKAIAKYTNRKLFADIEVEEYGLIKFKRPSDNEMLTYMDDCAKAVTTDEEGKVIDQDLTAMLEASKELVYSCCSFLQDAELRENLEVKDPLDTATKVFGINKTIEIAGQIIEEFEGEKVQKKVNEEIKN